MNTIHIDKKKKKKTYLKNISHDKKKKKKTNLSENIKNKNNNYSRYLSKLGKNKKKKHTKYNNTDKKKKHKRFEGSILLQPNDTPASLMGQPTPSRQYNWGLGIEHEMQLFHVPKSGWEDANIAFDSQESTCFLTGDMEDTGSCCKFRGNNCSNAYQHPSKKDSIKLKKDEYDWLMNMDWELTGRQAQGCKGGKWIVKRTPVLMPEIITGNHRNRTIESINNELIFLENKYIELQMKNPLTKRKVEIYGELKPYLCGSHDKIMVPQRPTVFSDYYTLTNKETYKDYLGSYHITITLPHLSDISKKDFVDIHRWFGMAFQWIEPLLMSAYFSPDPSAVGSEIKHTKGSYRVMVVGWGNMGGSDLRKIGTEGITRYANQRTYWRDKVKFKSSERLDICAKTAPPVNNYKKAINIHTSDFRTFNFAKSYDECVKLYNPNDCPKIDGGIMEPPYGIEVRIFDHFETHHLLSLLQIIILIAQNGSRHNPSEYVYKDQRWIGTMDKIMKQGWNAKLSQSYIDALRNNFGLKIETESNVAYDILNQLVKELFEMNKDGVIVKLMMEHIVCPVLPSVNRQCWELSFSRKYYNLVLDFINNNYTKTQNISFDKFKNDFLESFGKKSWESDIENVIYSLESHRKIKIKSSNGIIKSLTII